MRALNDEHAPALWSFTLRLTGDRSRAEDVVQETLLRAWRSPRVLDGTHGATRAWLFTVARHL
ncbi:MAG TPA: sigma factor, partial [Actinomycetes bacterium]